jgi:hypothetical protein
MEVGFQLDILLKALVFSFPDDSSGCKLQLKDTIK